MKHFNWNEIEAPKGFERLPAGGYVCGITAVEDKPQKEYLYFEFDIAEGEYKNRFRELYEARGFWGAHFIKSYKEKALGFFKKMLTAFEGSNKGFIFRDDEKELRRKLIGLVLGYEEYIGNDNTVKQRIYVADFLPADDIRAGRFDVPELKRLSDEDTDRLGDTGTSDPFKGIVDDGDDDLPFD